jgi:hypothetical protein
MKLPNRNYLAAQNKNLIQAGDQLFLAANSFRIAPEVPFHKEVLEKVLLNWEQAKENLMGLAGK